ncbi:hypothetical protein [Vibrio spartinae]|nr:hypothetical protein [Vibrio spartinae]SIO94619.1 L-asparaginase II [Vibrio spartinae]
MKKRYLVSAMMLLTSISSYADNLPHVTIYATGGTIAGASASNVDSTD